MRYHTCERITRDLLFRIQSIIIYLYGHLCMVGCSLRIFFDRKLSRAGYRLAKRDSNEILPLFDSPLKKSDMMHASLNSDPESFEIVTHNTTNGESADSNDLASNHRHVRSGGAESIVLPSHLAEYEKYIVKGGRKGLGNWLQSNGVDCGDISLPPIIFERAKTTRTPIQDVLRSGTETSIQKIRLAMGRLENIDSIPKNLPDVSVQKMPIESSSRSLTKRAGASAMVIDRKLDRSVEVDILDSMSKQNEKCAVSQSIPEESSFQLKVQIYKGSECSLYDLMEQSALKNVVVWDQSIPGLESKTAKELTAEDMMKAYEVCHFMGHNLGIAWHPDMDALLDGVDAQKKYTNYGREQLVKILGSDRKRTHSCAMSLHVLSSDDVTRRSIANASIYDGSLFFLGWRDWLESGVTKSGTGAEEYLLSQYFDDFDPDEILQANEPAKSIICKFPDLVRQLANRSEISLKTYRESAPLFLGWLTSLPLLPINYKAVSLGSKEKEIIMQMGLFFCYLGIGMESVTSIASVQSEQYRKIMAEANRRSSASIIHAMDLVLEYSMKISRLGFDDKISTDAINESIAKGKYINKASFYLFSHRVCNTLSRYIARENTLAARRNQAGVCDTLAKIEHAKKHCGDKWSTVLNRIATAPKTV